MPRDPGYNHVYVETDSETFELIPEVKPPDEDSVFHTLKFPVHSAFETLLPYAHHFLRSQGCYEKPGASSLSPVEIVIVHLAEALGNGEEVRQYCKTLSQSWFYTCNKYSGVRFFKRFDKYFQSYKYLAFAMGFGETKLIAQIDMFHKEATEMLAAIKNSDGSYGSRNEMYKIKYKAMNRCFFLQYGVSSNLGE